MKFSSLYSYTPSQNNVSNNKIRVNRNNAKVFSPMSNQRISNNKKSNNKMKYSNINKSKIKNLKNNNKYNIFIYYFFPFLKIISYITYMNIIKKRAQKYFENK